MDKISKLITSNNINLFNHTIGDLSWAKMNSPEVWGIGKQNIDYILLMIV